MRYAFSTTGSNVIAKIWAPAIQHRFDSSIIEQAIQIAKKDSGQDCDHYLSNAPYYFMVLAHTTDEMMKMAKIASNPHALEMFGQNIEQALGIHKPDEPPASQCIIRINHQGSNVAVVYCMTVQNQSKHSLKTVQQKKINALITESGLQEIMDRASEQKTQSPSGRVSPPAECCYATDQGSLGKGVETILEDGQAKEAWSLDALYSSIIKSSCSRDEGSILDKTQVIYPYSEGSVIYLGKEDYADEEECRTQDKAVLPTTRPGAIDQSTISSGHHCQIRPLSYYHGQDCASGQSSGATTKTPSNKRGGTPITHQYIKRGAPDNHWPPLTNILDNTVATPININNGLERL